MTRFCAAAAILAATFLVRVESRQAAPAQAMDDAAVAWDTGDYIAALSTYQQLLASPAADQVFEEIALQTGELYVTTELATDGAAPQFSPDGRYLTYETGTLPSRVIRLLRADGSVAPVAELHGYGAVFAPDGATLAYLRIPSQPSTGAGTNAPADTPVQAAQRAAALSAELADTADLVVRDLSTGRERVIDTGGRAKSSLAYGAGNTLLFASSSGDGSQQIYAVAEGQPATAITTGDGHKTPVAVNASGDALLFTTRPAGGRGGRGGRGGDYSLLALPSGRATDLQTADRPSFSADGRLLTFVRRTGPTYTLLAGPVADPASATVLREGTERIEAPALSRDGATVAFELMPDDDWEIYLADRTGGDARRLTREIQHDLQPQYLSADRLLAVMGEGRHRRSYLYDVATGRRTRLFHNNTVRTIAPEYSWTPSPDGTRILIVAERDGDTVSPERGVYLVDLTRKISREQLQARIASSLEAERSLRAAGTKAFAPIAAEVREVVGQASVARVYGYEKALFDFDSKHISQPGNARASEYLAATYKSFGYEPEFQWFEPRGALNGRSANVIATLTGTVNPELVYVVSSHYDSVAIGPGADDDSSGTAALLETARILARHPQPATIVFASFTGEESGLLGSREFVRRAVEGNVRIVGALNNDMVGWANDFRLDNTIRYSNPGIRDLQHGAAMEFTNLITYDALYYKSTDAAAYYEAYGDIVGGIGSYPVLGNPHYHQSHDLLDTINHQLVTEVAKTTAATLMVLASSPSRLAGLKVEQFAAGRAVLSWSPSPEQGVSGYLVSYTPAGGGASRQVTVGGPTATIDNVAAGSVVSVKAVNTKGLEGWDWARVSLPKF